MKRTWGPLLALGLVAGLAACQITTIDNDALLQVRWTFSGDCAALNVTSWKVTLSNGITGDYGCQGPGSWVSTDFLVRAGAYTATVQALDSAGRVLATRTGSGAIFGDGTIYFIDVGTFTEADFTGPSTCGNGVCQADQGETSTTCPQDCPVAATKAHVFWTINETEDGTDKGLSWDSCDEVGAAYLILTLDGATTIELPCTATKSAMNGSFDITPGAAQGFSAVLANSSKTALTSAATGTIPAPTAGSTTEIFINFDFTAFKSPLKESRLGEYLFTSTCAGGSCAQLGSAVAHEIALVKLDGTTLNGLQVCDLYSFCFNADGQTPGKAYAPTDTLRLKGTSLKWGLYTLLLQGVMTNLEMCYSVQDGGKNEATIFVGAGDVNPIINHDMKKASTNPACN